MDNRRNFIKQVAAAVPTSDPLKVKEGDNDADKSPGVSYSGEEDGKVIYEIESGEYRFVFDGVNKIRFLRKLGY